MSRRAAPQTVELIHPQRAKPFHRDGWVYEEKYDGWRIGAFKDSPRVRLVSRTGGDHASRFPELAQAIAALAAPTLILDGEVCRFDQKLVSRFHLLSEPDEDAVATPPVFMAFDCLYLRGRDLRQQPLVDRRRILEDIIDGHELLYVARRLADDGLKAWQQVQERGYEGLVAKDPRAPYDPQRTRWLKVKVRHDGRFVVGGVIQRDDLNALLVGSRHQGQFHFVGVVEFGVGRRLAEVLMREPSIVRGTSPFHNVRRFGDAVWLEPVFQADATYAEVMQGRLRDPVFRGVV